MTNDITINSPPCAGADEVTAIYLKTRLSAGNRYQDAIYGELVEINEAIYRVLGPIAAKQGLGITAFINRLCRMAIEAAPGKREVPFS